MTDDLSVCPICGMPVTIHLTSTIEHVGPTRMARRTAVPKEVFICETCDLSAPRAHWGAIVNAIAQEDNNDG